MASTTETTESKKINDTSGKDWIYEDLYPERRGGKFKNTWWKVFLGFEGREELQKIKCEKNVFWALQNSPLVKVMLGALQSAGCKFDIRRHISCEMCMPGVSGGFDAEMSQVVICQNVAKSKSYVQAVMVHEMIHMFDYCQNELDFQNIDHLACTEIRAATLTHCSFMSAMTSGTASPWNITRAHRQCVKKKALSSVMAVKGVTKEEAEQAIDRVFMKCYPDLEPIGRICRRNSDDFQKALIEAPLYGYEYKL